MTEADVSDPDWKALAGEGRVALSTAQECNPHDNTTEMLDPCESWAARNADVFLAALDRIDELEAKQPTAEEVEALRQHVEQTDSLARGSFAEEGDAELANSLRSLLARLAGKESP